MYVNESRLQGISTLAMAGVVLAGAVFFAQPDGNTFTGSATANLQGDRVAECTREGVNAVGGRIGCDPTRASNSAFGGASRLVGGARFVSAASR
jgi:hypothetical protein